MPFMTRDRIDFDAPMPRHLNCDMRSRPESVHGQSASGLYTREAQRAKSDNARAQERGDVHVRKPFGKPVDEVFGRANELGISAVLRPPGETRVFAEILPPGAAILASAIRMVQPGYTHA